MKKIVSLAVMLLAVLTAGACMPAQKSKETASMNDKKVLVAYFSWSGNTREAAKYIAQKLGADEFEIVREKAYPTDYEPCTVEAKAEKEQQARPAIRGRVERMEAYDVVFVGVPVWWYTAPMPAFTFLEQYDLKGKTIIPDHTLALSIIGDTSIYPNIEVDYPTAISYLRHEAITLGSEVPRGIVLLTYKHHKIGFAKNLGNRANNLYPQEWRIKSGYIPQEVKVITETNKQ